MSKTWDILRGSTVIATVHELEYHGEWMDDCYVSVTVKSSTPIDFRFGDRLTYRGEVFTLNYDPNVAKKASRGSYGEGFSYENVRLYSTSSAIKTVDFKDVVLADNNLTYTSLSEFSFYCSSIEDLADRLEANLKRDDVDWMVFTPNYPRTYVRNGSRDIRTAWNGYYPSLKDNADYSSGTATLGEKDVNMQVTQEHNCWDLTKQSYSSFGLSFYVRGRNIVIGGDAVQVNTGDGSIFRYGKGLGLYEIERTSDEDQEIVTKLFAYGSSQNLPLNYYANLHKRAWLNGNKIKWQIIEGQPLYSILTGIPVTQVSFHIDMTVVSVTIGSTTMYANLDYRSAVKNLQPDGTGWETDYDNDKYYVMLDLNFGIYNPDAEAVFNAYNNGSRIYINGGVDKNLWPQSYIENNNPDYPMLLSVNRLMLPGFPDKSLHQWVAENIPELLSKYTFSTDKHDPWVSSANTGAIGIIEGNVSYDGSSQKEIFPTIENTSAAVVTKGSEITDNGFLGENTDISFKIEVVYDSSLNWKEALSTAPDAGSVYMEMKSGYCTGRKFKVNRAEISDDGTAWVLTMEREKDPSMDRYFPYFDNSISGYCQVKAGDTFVVTGIEMPSGYIEAAARKLLIAACGYLDKRDHMRYTYLPKIDELFMRRDHDSRGNSSYYHTIVAGMKLQFEDSDLGIERYDGNGNTSPFIDQLTIKENGNNGIPTYDVVLRDEKEKGTLEKMAEALSDLANPTEDPTERQSRPTRDRTYDEWDPLGLYYYQTLNPEPDPVTGIVYIETSYVWHNGKLWMCLRTLTKEEPKFGCKDWKCVSVGTLESMTMVFYNTDTMAPYPSFIATRRTNIDIPITPKVFSGIEDITDFVETWTWQRYLITGEVDTGWVKPVGDDGSIELLTEDMPTGWNMSNPAKFECIATINDGTDDIELSADVTI